MEYIQKLFLKVGVCLQQKQTLNEIISLLETEPSEYRSVAYESASFEIALTDLNENQKLDRWKEFKKLSEEQHTFHIDIALGWAFAKAGLSPQTYVPSISSLAKWMVYDGVGYYYGLFKGRNTLKNKIIPEEIKDERLHGFDQGLGRRLWYIAKGNVNESIDLLRNFPEKRHGDLFRGIGIACGYVGGNEEDDLISLLKFSNEYYSQLQTGILLAAISRIASNTVNAPIEDACHIICNKTIEGLRMNMMNTTTNFLYLYNNDTSDGLWLTHLQSELLQTK
jgi:hypothetical protein